MRGYNRIFFEMLAATSDHDAPGSGSILEEFVYSLDVFPVEIQRYTSLMRELDGECELLKHKIKELHAQYLQAGIKITEKSKTVGDKEAAMKKLANSSQYEKLTTMRAALSQNIAEKVSISDQLYDMSEQNLNRIRIDITLLESILKKKGQITDYDIPPGTFVAAESKPGEWILATIKDFTSSSSDTFMVQDADDHALYSLPSSRVLVLPIEEPLTSAKHRLSSRGKKVMALYPSTTTFYKGTLAVLPYIGTGLTAGDFSPGSSLCAVQFDGDDLDPKTGSPPKFIVLTCRVFVPIN